MSKPTLESQLELLKREAIRYGPPYYKYMICTMVTGLIKEIILLKKDAETQKELLALADARINHKVDELKAEALRTAEEKLRADQMSQQHSTQAALNSEARKELAEMKAPQAVQKCEGCNGHGLVGGLLPGDGGYESEECPFCKGSGDAAPAYPAEGVHAAVIAGAIFDFAGYLTTLPHEKALHCSEAHEASPMVEAITEWCKRRGLRTDGARVETWRAALAAQAKQGGA